MVRTEVASPGTRRGVGRWGGQWVLSATSSPTLPPMMRTNGRTADAVMTKAETPSRIWVWIRGQGEIWTMMRGNVRHLQVRT
jgi:hypothetical protein